MTTWRAIVAAAVLGGFAQAALAAFSASLDRTQVGPGESVQLTLQRDGRGDSEPDLAPLAKDFEVLGKSSATSVQWINGSLSSQRRLQLMLAPRHSGQLPVPALTWDGEMSAPLTLEVSGTSGGNSGGASPDNSANGPADHVFLTSTVDQPSPYLQAAVTLTVRLHADQPLYRASLDLAASNDVVLQQIGKDVQTHETRDGRDYEVVERRYVLFPQRSGALTLPGPVLNAQIGDASDPIFGRAFGNLRLPGLVGATRPLRLNGDEIKLDVKPRPAAAGTTAWLPAQQVSLQESWQPANATVHVGEPLTRHLTLTALGQAASQLPDVAALMSLPDGVKAYPDQAKLEDGERSGSVFGQRTQDVALIAASAGTLTLPAVHLSWWDTASNSAREAVLPPRSVTVLPAVANPGVAVAPIAPVVREGGSASAPPPGPTASVSPPARDPWPWISLALGVVWLATLIAWWRGRNRADVPTVRREPKLAESAPGAREAHAAFERACHANVPEDARRALLAWERAELPAEPPSGLQALSARIGDPAIDVLLRELDRACYAGGRWDGAALARALPRLPPARPPDADADPLKSLYA